MFVVIVVRDNFLLKSGISRDFSHRLLVGERSLVV